MKKLINIFVISLIANCLLPTANLYAQSNKPDSLLQVLNTAKHDTTKIKALNTLAKKFITSKPDTALVLAQQALELSQAADWQQGLISSWHNIGYVHYVQSNYPAALKSWTKTLELREQEGDRKGMAASYNNIGIIYMNQSSYPQALEYYFKSLKIYKQLGDKQDMAYSYNNIGIIYRHQSSYPQALEYYFKALKMFEHLGDKKGMAASYTNIGSLYTALYEQGDNLERVGSWAAENPGQLLDTGLYYQFKAIELEKELSDEWTMTHTLSGIGSIYIQKKDYDAAIKHYQQAALLADSIGALKQGSEAHSGLAECYEQLGNYKLSLEHSKQYTTLKDTVFNEEKSKEIGRLEARHEMEMAEIKRKQEEEEQARILEQQTQRRHLLQYSGIFIFIIGIFAILLFSGIALNIPVRVAKSGVFFTFLLVFEFVLVLIDPYIEQWVGGEPAYMLMVNVALAGLFLPLHNFAVSKLEQRLFKTRKRKLEKKKRI